MNKLPASLQARWSSNAPDTAPYTWQDTASPTPPRHALPPRRGVGNFPLPLSPLYGLLFCSMCRLLMALLDNEFPLKTNRAALRGPTALEHPHYYSRDPESIWLLIKDRMRCIS